MDGINKQRFGSNIVSKPCLIWNCPQKLQNFAAEAISMMLLRQSIPREIAKLDSRSFCISTDQIFSCSMDKFIVDELPETQQQHFLLKKRIKAVKEWWKDNSSNYVIKKLVQDSAKKILNQMDKYIVSPLMKLVFQLCFTNEAGIFSSNFSKIHLEVPNKYCGKTMTDFLDFIGPFEIEKLYNVNMMFGSPKPLIVILKNSPELKIIHLRYNSCDYVLKHIGQYCSYLETLVIDECYGSLLVSEEYLYKAFYGGLTKNELQSKLVNMQPVPICFSNLKYVDFGKNRSIGDFLCDLRYTHPDIESISCNSSSFTAHYLMELAQNDLTPNVPYKIIDLLLTPECIMKLDKKDTWKFLPNVKHITISLERITHDQVNDFESKILDFLDSVDFSSLTFHMPFYGISDENIEMIFIPFLTSLGNKVKALQFDINRYFDISSIYRLINMCNNIELLSIRLSKSAALIEPLRDDVTLKSMTNIKYLCFRYIDRDSIEYFSAVIENILSRCPNIISLELMIPLNPESSLTKSPVIKLICRNVRYLILQVIDALSFQSDFFVSFIEHFPQLKTLILIDLPYSVYIEILSKRKHYDLEICSSRYSKVSYRGLASKYEVFYNNLY